MEEITGATGRSSSMGPASLRDGPGAMDAVGFSGELQDDRTVHQPVQKCRCQRRVPQVIGPRSEIDIGRQGGRTPSRAVAVHRCSCGYPPPSQGEEPCAKSRKRLLWRLITVIPSTARPNGFGRESTAMTPRLFRPRAGVGRRPSPETVAVRLLEGGEPVV